MLAKKGSNYLGKKAPGGKETLTVTITISDDGVIYPPFIIVKSASRVGPANPRYINQDSYPEAHYYQTRDGWMMAVAFQAYLEWLVGTLRRRRTTFPILLIVDGFSGHISIDISEYCKAHGVVLYCLPPNCTNILQPCDVTIMGPLKTYYTQEVRMWQMRSSPNACLTKYTFPEVLRQIMKRIKPEAIINGFAYTGISPRCGEEGPKTLRKLPEEVATTKEIMNNSLLMIASRPDKQVTGFFVQYADNTTTHVTRQQVEEKAKSLAVSEKNKNF